MDFRGVPPMKMAGNLSENWRFWKQRFLTYLRATEIIKKEQVTQCAQLLTLIGEDGMRIYNTFVFPDEDKDKLDPLIKQFDDHFNPRKNLTYVRHTFFTYRQTDGESIEKFVTELEHFALSCECGTLQDSLVKDMLICGVQSSGLREKLLQKADSKNLEETIQICINTQKCKERCIEISNGNGHPSTSVDIIKNKSYTKKPPQSSRCWKCGLQHEYRKCPAYGKHCGSCGGINHFAAVCNKKKGALADQGHQRGHPGNNSQNQVGTFQYCNKNFENNKISGRNVNYNNFKNTRHYNRSKNINCIDNDREIINSEVMSDSGEVGIVDNNIIQLENMYESKNAEEFLFIGSIEGKVNDIHEGSWTTQVTINHQLMNLCWIVEQ